MSAEVAVKEAKRMKNAKVLSITGIPLLIVTADAQAWPLFLC
jgi:hypothetical protein